MILKSGKLEFNGNVPIVTDLRKLNDTSILSVKLNPYSHKITELDNLSLTSIKYKDFTVKIPELTCNCNNFLETEKLMNLFCPHIINTLKFKLKNRLSPLTNQLIKNKKPNENLYNLTDENNDFILVGISPDSYWVSVYICQDEWKFFNYNLKEKRWAFGITPELNESNAKLINIALSNITVL